MHDLCLLQVGIFCGPRASEVTGLQWKSWTGEALLPYGTAYEGQFFSGRLKTKQSRAPIPVPEQVRPVIEAWRKLSKDSSPEALMFPTFGRGERKGTGGAALGQEFPQVADPSDRPQAGHPGPTRHLPSDAADAGNRHAAARDAEGHAGHVAAREHQDDRGCFRSDDRTERSRRRELAHVSGARRLDDAGWGFGPDGEKSERSECNSAKYGKEPLLCP